jgi:hypothetical protein
MHLSLEFGNVLLPLPDFGRTPADPVKSCRIPAILAKSGRISDRIHPDQWPDPSKSGQIQLDSGHFGQIGPDFGQFQPESGPPAFGDGGRMSPDSDAGCIPMFECCRILVPLGFRRSTNVGFRESDIKHAWKKNKEFNFGIITKSFTVKQKMIFVDHYFRPYQIL